jgi:hypothetical protein
MGNTLNVMSTLQCPHGGTVQIISANARVKAGGAFAALATDQYLILGCPFIVGLVPMPCLTVQWILTDLRVKVNGTPTLSQSSVGLCLNGLQVPQGPVLITNAQVQAKSQ